MSATRSRTRTFRALATLTNASTEFGELGRGTTGSFNANPAVVTALTNQYVVAIAGGLGFTLAVTSNGQVYAWGDNTFGELGTYTSVVPSTNLPMLVGGIGNVVLVSAPRTDDGVCDTASPFGFCTYYSDGNDQYMGGVHVVAMTVDGGTNHYWGWGDNTYGQIGQTGSIANGGATHQVSQYTPVGPLQFCTRCQREVQLGTNGSFTAHCSGTLYLYFNTDDFGDSYVSGSYTATVVNLTNNVVVWATNYAGVAIGTVTVGNVYTYTASGYCTYDSQNHKATPDGRDSVSNNLVDCSFSLLNITNSVCPSDQCFSLVGKIQ